jgi:hypothetical protein
LMRKVAGSLMILSPLASLRPLFGLALFSPNFI